MKAERWMPILGYEGLYEVSDLGRIKSLPRIIERRKGSYLTKEKTTFGSTNRHGYKSFSLFKDKKEKKYDIHRLVCMSFIKIEPGKDVVNHKNAIRTDNRVENLEWCTQKENVRHSFNVLKKPSGRKGNKYPDSRRKVICDGVIYNSLKEAGLALGINGSCISRAIKTSKGVYGINKGDVKVFSLY